MGDVFSEVEFPVGSANKLPLQVSIGPRDNAPEGQRTARSLKLRAYDPAFVADSRAISGSLPGIRNEERMDHLWRRAMPILPVCSLDSREGELGSREGEKESP